MKPSKAKPIAPNPFLAVRRAGAPVCGIETADPAATIKACNKVLNGKAITAPLLAWDFVSGIKGLNEPGKTCVQDIPQNETFANNPAGLLAWLSKSPPQGEEDGEKFGGVVYMHNAHRFLDEVGTMQAAWNCRDALKGAGVTLVLLGPAFQMPPEIARDVIIISEALPDAEQLGGIVDSLCSDAGLPKPEGEHRARTLNTLLGLGAFEAEQVLALSLNKDGLDHGSLWERKVKAIEQTQGLTVFRGKEKFSDLGGLENAKKIIGETIRGKLNISCVVLLDEIDKALAAAGTDMSGTTQDQNKVLLSYMQDHEITGSLFLGPPGTGKTSLCKAAANEHDIPLIMLDLGAMKGSLVGQSEQQLRQAMKVIHAVSDGRALFIGACNRSENLPPELRRRFNYCSIFFDLPDEAERNSAFAVWSKRYELAKEQCDWKPPQGWTGAEVRNVCLKSWAMGCKLSEAAKTVVPIAKSASDIVEGLRKAASGKYISASASGLYNYQSANTPAEGRRIER